MKRILVLVLTIAVLASSFVMPSVTAAETTDIGGLDFYSITFHYSKPTVVGYELKERDKLDENGEVVIKKGEPVKEKYLAFAEPVDSFTIKVSESVKDQIINSAFELEILDPNTTTKNSANTPVMNFYSAVMGFGVVSKLQYTRYPTPVAGITNISDGSILKIKDTDYICGIDELYDANGERNPNLAIDDKGYFIDTVTGNRVDDNGFVLDANNLWHENDGVRVEPFAEGPDGKLTWIPLDVRVADGKVMALSDISGAYLIEKGILPEYPAYDKAVDYDGNNRVTKADQKAYDAAKSNYENNASIKVYRIKTDANDDKKITKDEIAAIDDFNKKFTEDDIELFFKPGETVGTKNIGTPVEGALKMNATIESITIEIDALGAQLYDDVTKDPQQNNTITLTIGNTQSNIKLAEEIVAKNPKKINNSGSVIGTAKSVTTKTSLNLTEGAEKTTKSITLDATPEALALLRNGAAVYLNFGIKTTQNAEIASLKDYCVPSNVYFDGEKLYTPDEYEALKGAEKKLCVKQESIVAQFSVPLMTEAQLADVPSANEDDGDSLFNQTWFIITLIAAGVVIIVIVVVVIVLSKKKKKAATAETTEASAEENKED